VFKSFANLANLASLVRQAQGLGSRFQVVNDRLRDQRVSGSAGGGMVEVEANGLGEILRLRIDPALIERGEHDMIETLAPAAINQAIANAKQLHAQALQDLAGEFDLPGVTDAISQFMNGQNNEK
jgi:hypothetical protein